MDCCFDFIYVYFFFFDRWSVQFTPILASFHRDLIAAGRPFEVVFVSSDHDQTSFGDYLATHPWLAVPFLADGGQRRAALGNHFGVWGIPKLILIDPQGTVLTTDGQSQVYRGIEAYPFTDASTGSCSVQ